MMCSSLAGMAAAPIPSHLSPLHRHASLLPSPASPNSLSTSLPSSASIALIRLNAKIRRIAAVARASESIADPKENLGMTVKVEDGNPRIVLKFVWLEKKVGLGLDQVVPGYGTIPLSGYYFWPRKDAWEELKRLLESKPWISRKRMMVLLDQAAEIINLWQQSESAGM